MPTRLPLTPEQRKAAATTESHTFIVASPGAGKTTVAAERYGIERYLGGSATHRTLGVSFARSATQELRDRVRARWGTGATNWPNEIATLDALHCELVRYLLVSGTLRWPGGHTDLTVLDTWRGQDGCRYLLPDQGYRRVATLNGRNVTSSGERITRTGYGIGTKAAFESYLRAGVCTHEEIRAVLSRVFLKDGLRAALEEYLRTTTSALIVDEVFDANHLDVALIKLARAGGHSHDTDRRPVAGPV